MSYSVIDCFSKEEFLEKFCCSDEDRADGYPDPSVKDMEKIISELSGEVKFFSIGVGELNPWQSITCDYTVVGSEFLFSWNDLEGDIWGPLPKENLPVVNSLLVSQYWERYYIFGEETPKPFPIARHIEFK